MQNLVSAIILQTKDEPDMCFNYDDLLTYEFVQIAHKRSADPHSAESMRRWDCVMKLKRTSS